MRISRLLLLSLGAIGASVTFAGTAFAGAALSATIGPVAIPSVPVSVCVTAPGIDKCVKTPAAQSVTLKVTASTATPSIAATPPSIMEIPCPAGTSGAAAAVSTGSATVTITGSATVALSGKPPVTVPIAPAVGLPGKTVKVYACTGVS